MASGLPDAVRAMTPTDSLEISLVPEQKDSAHARFYDDAGSASVSRYRRTPCYLLKDGEHRHPEVGFRRSMAGLRTPLATLRIDPRGPLRMTRGRCGSLNLHRKGLAPSTSCRSPRAPVHTIMWGLRASMPRRSMWRVAQFDTLRLRLIKVAARIVEIKTMIRVHLPASCPAQDILRLVLGRIPRLVT